MNLRDHFKAIQKEIKKHREDATVQQCLQIIVDKFFQSGEVQNSIELDAYHKDYIFERNEIWEDPNITFKQRVFAHNEDKRRLQSLCLKLNEFGFKCKAVAKISKMHNGTPVFHTPWISVKL